MQQIRRTTGIFVLFGIIVFSLSACGGGGGDAAPDLSPTATTSAATTITNDNAVLNAVVNPKGLATTAWFEHSKDPALSSNVTATTTQNLGAGSADINVTQNITGLDPGATYYYRVKANNSAGTKSGAIYTFNTLPLPTVTTNAATSKTTTGAVLNGDVNPNGRTTTARFEYGKTTALGTFTDNQSVGGGTNVVQVAQALTNLDVATKYYYRIEATSTAGTAKGTILDFTTAGGVPTVVTSAASSITATGGTLNGIVNPNALATNAWFEYGATQSLGSFSDNQSLGSGSDNVSINKALNLSPGDNVYYRVAANNSVGTSRGDIYNFTTLNPAPTAEAGPAQTIFMGKLVTLDGSGSSDGYGGTLSYLWAQTQGTTVTLSSTTAQKPTFTAPTVTYPSEALRFRLTVTSTRGPSASDNVIVTVKYGFLDDFSSDSTGTYAVTQTLGSGSTFTYDSGAGAALVTTGAGKALKFERDFGIGGGNLTNVGEFSLIFLPTDVYATGDGIRIRLGEVNAGAYYEISTFDNTVKKVFPGEITESKAFTFTYVPYTVYVIKFIFSQEATTIKVEDSGGGTLVTATLNVLQSSISAYDFNVETKNLRAYYDDIKLQAAP